MRVLAGGMRPPVDSTLVELEFRGKTSVFPVTRRSLTLMSYDSSLY